MTTNEQRSRAAPVNDRRLQTAEAMLHAGKRFWQATTPEAVVEEAADLLPRLVPGASITRCAAGVRPLDGRQSGCMVDIALAGDELLRITAPDPTDEALLEPAIDAIRIRMDTMHKRQALSQSIKKLEQSERLQRALYAIADQASAAETDLTTMYKALHGIVGTLMYARNFYIALHHKESDGLWFPYFADSIDPEPPFDMPGCVQPDTAPHPVWSMAEMECGPTWYLIRHGKPIMGTLQDIAQQVSGPFQESGAPCMDMLGVPLIDDGEVIGCIVVQSYERGRQYREQDKDLLVYVAQHIQTALQRRWAHQELELRVEERTRALTESNRELEREVQERRHSEQLQAALFRIAELAGSTESLEAFYAAIHDVVGGLLYARNFYIALLSTDGEELLFPYQADEYDGPGGLKRPFRNGFTEYVLRRGSALLLADQDAVEELCASGDVTVHGSKPVCWLGVPLVFENRVGGVLAVQSYRAEYEFSQRDQELLTFVSYHIANALERKRAAESLREANERLEDRVRERTEALARANNELRTEVGDRRRAESQLKHQTLHDALTGLPNRKLFLHRLQEALTNYKEDGGRSFAVLFMDLDRFKIINDSEGHLVGDDLLIQVGKRVNACLKDGDTVARLGGDEFGVLLENIEGVVDACRIAERIIGSLNDPFRLGDKDLFTSTSIGVTLSAPRYNSPDELLRDADSAMYRAKAVGRHRCEVFDERMRQQAVSLLEIRNDLRHALSRKEFVPYYQPVVALDSGRIVGYEALMRWRHPQRGMLLPGQFMGVAEDMGIIATIDWQIYEGVCRDAKALVEADGGFVSINLSAHHFSDPGFDRKLQALLARNSLPASCIRVEVTEHALLANTPAVKRILYGLRRAGIAISLDDFGTGYSSLSYLHRYPLQTLKIDQSFVANLADEADDSSDAVIRAILAMAENLSINVIAEGVESQRQRDRLRELGCTEVQGFLYSKAEPASTWIGNRPHHFDV